jgi:hypothetical protein
VPEVVEPDRLPAANTRLMLIDRGVVQFVVPPVGGLLAGFGFGVPGGVAVAAAPTALVLSRDIPSTAVAPPTGHVVRDIAEGVPLGALTGGVVASWTGLRSVWLVAAAIQVVATAIQVVALAVAWRGMSPRAFAAAERAANEGAATAVAG